MSTKSVESFKIAIKPTKRLRPVLSPTLFLYFCRCLSKTGVGAIQMPPLEASWLVKACCVLHNRCIDWGLRRMRPGKNKDPEHENKIQNLAHRRFLTANQREVDSDDDGDHDVTQVREVALEGIQRCKLYIHKNYGGPQWRTFTLLIQIELHRNLDIFFELAAVSACHKTTSFTMENSFSGWQ